MRYVIRVLGRLSDDLLSAFPELAADEVPVQTVLHGELPDQTALTSILDSLTEQGITIVDVAAVPPTVGAWRWDR